MPSDMDSVWTALVLLFWFWPILLAVGYIAVASVWAGVRMARGYSAHLPAQAPQPHTAGGS